MAKSLQSYFNSLQRKRRNRHIASSVPPQTALERIADALEPNQEGVCDDCLSIAADVKPRQQVNQICRGLAQRGLIARSQGECPVCKHEKLVNLPSHQVPHSTKPVKVEESPARLDQLRRQIVGILNSIETHSNKGEGLAARIMRLREAQKLPGSVACMMQTLNALRNLAVYEGFAPGQHELAVMEAAWAAVEDWRDESIRAAN